MTQEDLQNTILQKFPGLPMEPLAHDPTFIAPLERFFSLCEFLKNEEEFAFENLMCMTAVDNLDSLDAVYFLSSYAKKHRVALKVKLSREAPEIPSVTPLWPGANWHEREAFDLYGVKFTGHPDLRRILLPDDWEGFPMRKDYTHWNLVHLPDEVTQVTKDYPLTPSVTPYGE